MAIHRNAPAAAETGRVRRAAPGIAKGNVGERVWDTLMFEIHCGAGGFVVAVHLFTGIFAGDTRRCNGSTPADGELAARRIERLPADRKAPGGIMGPGVMMGEGVAAALTGLSTGFLHRSGTA
jgi:hypothetical protein